MFRFLFLALALAAPSPVFAQTSSPDALFTAAGRGDLHAVSALVAQGVDVNALDVHGNTALAWAELSGDPETIEARNKEEDRKPQIFSSIVWFHPLERGHPDTVALLITRGANVNAKDSHYGRTALIWAAIQLQAGLVKILLDKGADRTLQDKDGQTALSSASEFSPKIIKLLIDWTAFGRKVNAPDQSGRTPLMYAGILNDVPHLQTLTQEGADVNAASPYGDTALILAARGHNDALRFLLSHGANPNTGTKTNWNALLAASRFGDSNSVKILLDAGADPNRGSDPNGDTPLMAATETGDIARVKLLIAKGADVNLADPMVHRTALMKACQRLDNDETNLLLDHGAQANAKSGLGETPLAYACGDGNMGGDVALVKRLLEGGADPNVGYKWGGQTALYWAISRSNTSPEIVRLLLAHGADVNAKLNGTETVLRTAQQYHQAEIIALLQNAGAKE